VWLYLTRRLELADVPNDPPWVVPAFWLGEVVYYRLTPAVLAWLEAAGEKLDAGGQRAFVEAMAPVWEFAERWLDPGEVSRARRAVPPAGLPEPPRRVVDRGPGPATGAVAKEMGGARKREGDRC
jgi:hypothetical protein